MFISGYVTLGFGGYLESVCGLPRVVGALGLIAGCLLLGVLGVRITGTVQAAVTGLAIAGLCAFALWGAPDVRAHRFLPFWHMGPGGVLSAALLAFLAFGGFDMVAAASEEIERPERNVPRAILVTLAVVLAVYLSVCLVALGVMGAQALGASHAPLADAAQSVGGQAGRGIMIFTALFTTAATANAVLVVTSRISFAMARDGLLPAVVGRVDERTGAPSVALAVSALILGLVALTGSVRIAAAVGGFLYVLHFLVPLIALVVLRRRGERAPPTAFQTPRPRMILPLALVACATLLVAAGPVGAAGGAGWMALGAAGYRLAARH